MRITKDPESRREDILEAALGLFREEGFEKVSVESIAQKAGIAKGSFYNYFKSKEDVYDAAIKVVALKTLESAKEILTEKGVCSKERLMRYISWTFHLSEQQDKNLRRILDPNENSSVRQLYLRSYDEGIALMLPLFEQLLEDGKTYQEFELSDARFTAVAMLGAFRGIHVAYFNGLKINMATAKSYLYDFLSRLLGAKF